MKVDAILWDYDGTLVNSVPKNINITRQIFTEVVPRLSGENLPFYLKSEKEYQAANHKSQNWKDLYLNYYGLTESETIKAGSLWTEYQLKDPTPVSLFPEIKQTINQIHLPQGICSQNSAENIKQVLLKNGLQRKFISIVGYDDIPNEAQKPFPMSGLICLNQIFGEIINKTIFYIGDHPSDVEFTKNLGNELDVSNKIFSIIVKYSGADTRTWKFKPDFEISSPFELLSFLNHDNS
jgi:phosphoglycolate phosphatase-like HAD superfamily hydrolase